MCRSFAAFLLLIVVACPAFSAPPDPKSLAVPSGDLAKSRQLVRQLGSEQFSEREDAEESLAKMGRLARLALLEGVNSDPNPEIRTRCESLLPRANHLEMKARLEVFLADTEGKYEHDLPGWNQFRATACNDWTLFGYCIASDRSLEKAARAVFVELISTPVNKSVVMAVGGSQTEITAVTLGRRYELFNQRVARPIVAGGLVAESPMRREINAEDVAALLFAESFAAQSPARVPRTVSISVLLNSSGFSTQVRESNEKGRVYRAIASAWMESRINPMDLYQAMNIASNIGLGNQSSRMAARLMIATGAPPSYRGYAATTLVRGGSKEQIPLLEKAFEDTSVLPIPRGAGRVNEDGEAANNEIQVRDLSLAVSIQLAGEKPEDYGFVDQYRVNTAGFTGNGGYSYTRYCIPSEKRAAAFEKWKEWWAKNRDK